MNLISRYSLARNRQLSVFLAVFLCSACVLCLLWRSARGQSAKPALRVEIEGHRDAAEASVSTRAMRYIPFDVPPGVTRLTIHREYDHGQPLKPKNTVDFGVFDNRGVATGIRGWQGGSPGDYVVTGDYKTCSPHAIPGPIPAGRWYVAQYYLVGIPAGLDYKYTVTFSFDGPVPPAAFPTPGTYSPGIVRSGPDWYAGNLHAHSLNSDGGRPFEEMIGRCADAGFDFVVSTEHNSPTAHFRFPEASRAHPNVLLLYGDEFTSPGGHAGIIGQPPGRWYDFRMDPGDGKLPKVIADAHREGALFSVNHPYAPCTSCTWKYPESEWVTSKNPNERADAIEVWNGAWTPDDRAATDLWDRFLKSGQHLNAFGGTDYHRGEDPLSPTVFVYAPKLSQPSILDGLRRGHAFLSSGPKGPRIYLTASDASRSLPGDTVPVAKDSDGVDIRARVVGATPDMRLRLIWRLGETRVPVSASADGVVHFRVPLPPGQNVSYVRAELSQPGPVGEKMAALTNALYLERKQ